MQETNDTIAAEPAPHDPKALAVLPPPERAAVALGTTATEQHLRGLIAKTAEIKNVVDANGRHEAHSAAMMLKNARVAVVNVGKTAREDAVAFQRAIIAESDRLAGIVTDEETRLFKLRDDFDDKVAAEKAERERVEAARKAAIRAKIDAILRLPAQHAGYDSAALGDVLRDLAAFEPTPENFAEFADEARTAIDTTASALMTLREGASKREEQARQDAEARRLEAERIEAQRIALEAQKAEQDRAAAELAEQRAELARIQVETERTRIAVEAARAETRRREQEVADAERRQLEQAAADLEEQRAAFAREQADARAKSEARLRAESQPAPQPEPAPPAIEILPAEPELSGLVDMADLPATADEIWLPDAHEMIENFTDADLVMTYEGKPDDVELIDLMCSTYSMQPYEAIERLAAFNAPRARELYEVPNE